MRNLSILGKVFFKSTHKLLLRLKFLLTVVFKKNILLFNSAIMEKLKVIILDDEQEALNLLNKLLIETGKVTVCKKLDNPLNLESAVASINPDAVFSDIQMPNYSGIDILKNLRTYRPELPFIYVTAHEKFSLEAAKNNSFGYLLKPVNKNELNLIISRLTAFKEKTFQKSNSKDYKISLPVKDGLIYVQLDEILYLTADGTYTEIKLTDENKHISSYNMGKLHKQLPEKQFLRINRKMVVNAKYIIKINKRERYCIVKYDSKEEQLEISRPFIQSLNN